MFRFFLVFHYPNFGEKKRWPMPILFRKESCPLLGLGKTLITWRFGTAGKITVGWNDVSRWWIQHHSPKIMPFRPQQEQIHWRKRSVGMLGGFQDILSDGQMSRAQSNLMLLKASFLGCATIDYLILVASTATRWKSEENHRSGWESLRNIPNVWDHQAGALPRPGHSWYWWIMWSWVCPKVE